ncbi:MAG: spermidine/putrescine ABC transporter ATP-binding protein [Thermoprotei archaeon]|nr:MAG: spermidine/putrescine ABC transporter ATP-binding protein [Thermoprotei archaeon]
MSGTTILELKGITKVFDDTIAVDNLSLEVREGEFITLLGPSGCGKTTTLRIIAGLTRPTKGRVILSGTDITDWPPYARNMSMVFQNYALFPHMNVFDNVAFGLKMRKLDKREIKNRVREVLRLVRLEGYENRMPHQLSGGQQQRVALARALVVEPKVLLLDEPLSNLDAKLRVHMRTELKRIQKQIGITSIYVTHDQAEALSMSDRVAIMNKGKLLQVGTPEEIYERPKSKFVADFIGEMNFLKGKVDITASRVKIMTDVGFNVSLAKEDFPTEYLKHKKVFLCIRPEHMEIYREPTADALISGKILDFQYLGHLIKYFIELENGQTIIINQPRIGLSPYNVGQRIYIRVLSYTILPRD